MTLAWKKWNLIGKQLRRRSFILVLGRTADKSATVAWLRLISWPPFLSVRRLKWQQHRISAACLSLTFLFLSADKFAWDRALSFVSYCLIYYSFKHFPECFAVTVLMFILVLTVRRRKNTFEGNVLRQSVLPWLSVFTCSGLFFWWLCEFLMQI